MANPLIVWKAIYITVLAGVGMYLAFWAINTQFLTSQVGGATVINKEYRKAGATYVTERIGNTTRVIARATPEMYILKLRVGGKEAQWPVLKEYFDRTHIDDQLQVRYEEHRITGSLRIVSIESQSSR